LKHHFVDFNKVVLYCVLKVGYEFSGPIAYLKLHISDLVQVAVLDAQDAENELA
jgi:hypothetical protein